MIQNTIDWCELIFMLERKSKQRGTIAKRAGVSNQAVGNWRLGNNTPCFQTGYVLLDLFAELYMSEDERNASHPVYRKRLNELLPKKCGSHIFPLPSVRGCRTEFYTRKCDRTAVAHPKRTEDQLDMFH